MARAILFDADGVTIRKQPEYMSERFVRECGAPAEEVRAFFKKEFVLCQLGKADLKEELSKRLPAWGWDKGTDEFLHWWFSNDADLAQDVLAEVARLRASGVVCCLTTDQEKYRAAYLRDKLGLGAKFDHLFFSYELGCPKSNPEFFVSIMTALGLGVEDITYFDDDQHNVDTAKSLGIDVHVFTNVEQLRAK